MCSLRTRQASREWTREDEVIHQPKQVRKVGRFVVFEICNHRDPCLPRNLRSTSHSLDAEVIHKKDPGFADGLGLRQLVVSASHTVKIK